MTESWSSRARWARSSPAASSPAWRRRSRSSRSRSLTSRAAPWAPTNAPSVDHADAVDLDQDVVAVGVPERQARSGGPRSDGGPATGTGPSASRRALGAKTSPVRAADQLGRLACRASTPAASLTNVSVPVGVGHPDEVRRRRDEVAVALLGLAQLALEALALADVAGRAVDAGEPPVVVDACRGADLDRGRAARPCR